MCGTPHEGMGHEIPPHPLPSLSRAAPLFRDLTDEAGAEFCVQFDSAVDR